MIVPKFTKSNLRNEIILILEESLQAQVQSVMQQAVTSSGLRVGEIAKQMYPRGKQKTISRYFKGSHNLKLKTVARLLAICGYELKVSIDKIKLP